jgi:hypothetical protein
VTEPAALAGVGVGQPIWTVERDALVRMLDALDLGRIDVDLVVSMLSMQDSTLAPFEMRVGNWSITVSARVGRALFNSTALTGALAAIHEPSIPAAVLTFVVSALFDVDRIEVSAKRDRIEAVLREPADTIEDWYRQQPEHVRAELTEAQFRMVVHQFRDVGPAEQGGRLVELRLPGNDEQAAPTVFISYAHDSPEHKEAVRRLADLLRDRGLPVVLDQWATGHRKDWSTWAPKAIVKSDFTLMIASPDYKTAADDFEDSDRNPGVQSEAAIIRDLLHGDRARWKRRFLPILLPGHDKAEIPYFMQPNSADWYRIDDLSMDGIQEVVDVLLADRPARPPTRAAQVEAPAGEPRWQQLEGPAEVTWRADAFGRPGFTVPSALELHLVPVGSAKLTLTRLRELPNVLATRGRETSFFSSAEALDTGWSEDFAWALSSQAARGIAVFRNGQRTAWVPLIKASLGTIVNRDYARENFTQILALLTNLALPLPATLAPTAGLEPASMVRDAPVSDASSGSVSMRSVQAPSVRLPCDESLTSEEVLGMAEAVADELAVRVLARLNAS